MADRPPWRHRSLLILLVAIFLAQAIFFSRTLLFSDDEEGYVVLGYLAARGTVSLFQDEMLGARTPLPFYILGWPQRVMGRSLWGARLLCIVFAVGTVWLTIRTARILGGRTAGVLAGFLLVTQGAIVGYFATAGYHAISAFVVMAVVQFFIGPAFSGRYLVAAASTGLIFLTRTHISPLIPLLLTVCIIRSSSWRDRLLVLGLGAATPMVFLLSDPTHLKLLAYAGPFEHLAARWGYRSIFYFYDYPRPLLGDQLKALLLFARRYESLTVAAAGLLVAALWSTYKGRTMRAWRVRPEIWLLIAVLVYGVACLFLIVAAQNLKLGIAYFPAYAPVAAVLLGIGFARLLSELATPAPARFVAVVALCVALVISVVSPRQPLLPPLPGRPFQDDAIVRLDNLARGLERTIPAGSRVFLLGDSIPLYLADRQILHPATLAAHDEDPWLVARNGVWGRDQIEEWLTRDAMYAVIAPRWIEAFRPSRTRNIERIEELLAAHFSRIAILDDYFGIPYHVYRRNAQ
jgi:4-amino-4-deoxy-L-arabinose transferase-like glycosyltransferase